MLALKNFFKSYFKKQQGYSLIQMAIAIAVLGALTAPFLNLYTLQKQNNQTSTTAENRDAILNSIQQYKMLYGVYPCPAPMSIARSDPMYGHEVDYDPASSLNLSCRDATIEAMSPGTCGAAGPHNVCIQKAIASRVGLPSNRVVVGSIPFRLLQLDEIKTVDGYGSKFLYAITESLTNPDVANEKNGAIQLLDSGGNTLTKPDGAAVFALVSHGKDRVGGYTLDGVLEASCSGVSLDVNNCNPGFESSSSPSPIASYRDAMQNDAAGAMHFDDTVSFFVNQSDPLWKRTMSSYENIQDLSEKNVGIGTAAPTTTAQLDIGSQGAGVDSIRVNGSNGTDGKILVDQVCDYDHPTLCFDPALFGSDSSVAAPTRLQCPAGKFMTGINAGQPVCQDMSSLAIICTDPSKPILAGMNADGTPKCQPLAATGCPLTQVSLCSPNDSTLPAANQNATKTLYAGDCYQAQYKCNTSSAWVPNGGTGGYCKDKENDGENCGFPCGYGYGNQTYCQKYKGTLCTGTHPDGDTFAADCHCVGAGPDPVSRNCSDDPDFGSGWAGKETATKSAAPPTCEVTQTPWDTSACHCSAGDPGDTRWVANGSCNGNFIAGADGPPMKEQKLNGSCQWVDDGNTKGGCVCNGGAINTFSQNHVCDNPTCEVPDPAHLDWFQQTVDPDTCNWNPATPIPPPGSCLPKSFKWAIQKDTGTTMSGYPNDKVMVGDGCTCAESQGPLSGHCFVPNDGSFEVYVCKCQ